MIGQQSLFHLEVCGPASLHYRFPAFPGDTLTKGIEILYRGRLDTVRTENGQIELKADYVVTSFDSGLYYIPPVPVLVGNDTVESNYLGIKVMTYSIDTTKIHLYDIKDVQSPPFVWTDYLTELLLGLMLYVIALLVIWFILRKKYRVAPEIATRPVSNIPPHVLAIMELDRIKNEKIWKQGKNKLFYTELSDVLRRYIERRFGINALEMTTDEILDLFRRDKTTQSTYQNLRQILQLADLVKFAKIDPGENENELSIMNSYLFINQTKLEELKSVEEQKEALSKEADPTEASKNEPDTQTKYMP
jgi:hypothetical protein